MQGVQTPLPVRTIIRKRYVVVSLLGKGNSGAVYLVENPRIKDARHTLFVLKEVIVSDEQERNRSLRRAAQLHTLRHRGLPRIHEVFHDDKSGCIYLLMEYIDGESLENLLQNLPEHRFLLDKTMSIMAPIFATVGFLHQQHPLIIHGDIKPATVITLKTGFIRSLLVDFSFDQKSEPISSIQNVDRLSSYKAPEQWAGEVSVPTDIYGLGATFYTLLTGLAPANALARMSSLVRLGVDPVKQVNEVAPHVPFHIGKVVDRAISLDPRCRFASVDQFWWAFWLSEVQPLLAPADAQLATDSASRVTEQTIEQRPMIAAAAKKARVRRPWKLAISLVPLLLLIAFVAWIPASRHFAQHTTAPTPKVMVSLSLSPTSPTSHSLLASAYSGTLFDVAAHTSAKISLSNVREHSGHISGYLSIGPLLQVSGSFSGTIDAAHHLQFMVTDTAGNPLLFFEGMVQKGWYNRQPA